MFRRFWRRLFGERIRFGEKRIKHGSEVKVETVIKKPCKILELKPHSWTKCLGTLGVEMKCACYGRLTVKWNVREGKVISKKMLPFKIVGRFKFEAWKGEFWGEEKGEPASNMAVHIYPEIKIKTFSD